ncbi:hypothetical protein QAD02_023379 [Eretmocerus hayati]|uniref:Uncharacterized protein n=1 Tax=Eretmocerus hayati TaxID=131215 RepID=A0ACC2Q0J7_9HYME|nr:hypothetical protein QAD02_023379 [Eretmocerus hayati]
MNDARIVFMIYLIVMCIMRIEPLTFDKEKKLTSERSHKSGHRKKLPQIFGDSFDVHAPDFIQLVSKHGYPAEEHLVTTADGYKLKIHRIPGSPTHPKAPGKPIVYFQHGLLASSDCWVLFGPEKDLTFMMADAGFDVWVGNIRGNTYSRSHVSLDPDYDHEFWQYSWHEMGIYDIPAIIDHILDLTGERGLIYVGHSMGTTISYVLLSIKPEYNDKIWLAVSFAPVAIWTAPPSYTIKLLKLHSEDVRTFIYAAGVYEIMPRTKELTHLIEKSCGHRNSFHPMCLDNLWTSPGHEPQLLNESIVPYIYSFFPAGTSRQTLEHFHQNIDTGDFTMFNYSPGGNLDHYGQSHPPRYNLKKIITHVALYYGASDALAPPQNSITLAEHLPNVAVLKRVDDDHFNHYDFLVAKDIKLVLNNPVLHMVTNFLERRRAQ